ncbi:MAG: hypothetical protein ACRDYA_14295 [Egibacteraceae bacterium]
MAEQLDTTVASVNSALQRARSTLASGNLSAADAPQPMDDAQRALLARYVDAFERYDVETLRSLLREDATPVDAVLRLWLRGPPRPSAGAPRQRVGLSWLAFGLDRDERFAGVRAVPAQPSARPLRAVGPPGPPGPPGPRDLSRSDRRAQRDPR